MRREVVGLLWLFAPLLTACGTGVQGSDATALPSAQGTWPTAAAPAATSPNMPSHPGCYYVWATRELPELTQAFQDKWAQYSGSIQASAYAFGEECRGDDGTVAFLPMETDFRVRIPVPSLADDAALGTWISRAMSIVEALPASELPGTRPGRVEYEFYVDETSSLRLIVEIARYRSEAADLDSAAILRLFRERP